MSKQAIENAIALMAIFALTNTEMPRCEEMEEKWQSTLENFRKSLRGTVCPCMMEHEQSTQ